MSVTDISVIIPVYNSRKTIAECIDSVVCELCATDYSWELVLVDDGSTDDSLEKLYRFKEASLYSEQIRIISQTNKGAASARNAGIKASSGTFIAFNDSDDKWLPGKIKKQMDYLLNHPQADLTGGAHEEVHGSYFKNLKRVNPIGIKDMVLKNYFSPQAVVIRKKALDDTGLLFDESMRSGFEECSLFYPLTYYRNCILMNEVITKSITGKRRWGDSGLSGNIRAMEKGELYNIKNAYRSGFISFGWYLTAYTLSLLKFSRRLLICQKRKLFGC
ncbi:Chondroitin polymerase [Bacteroidales bacterium Barb4]|nr:Chondroitin polymerase [Bacteroidales bacterium Barb4]